MRLMTSALKQVLKDSAGVAAIAQKRVYTDFAPQDSEMPNVIISTLSGNDPWTQQGPMNFHRYVVRVTARALRESECAALGVAVYDALQNYSGTVLDIEFDRIFHRNTNGDYSDGPEIEREIFDFEVRWRRV